MPRGKKLSLAEKAVKAQEQTDKRAAAAAAKEARESAKALLQSTKRKYVKKEGVRASIEPEVSAEPEVPHVNKTDHQLLNIHRPIQELVDITKKRYDEDKAKEEREKEFELDLETQKENRLAGNRRSHWSIIKPLKPSPLDDYDKAIEAKRANQRLATSPNLWTLVRSR